MARKTKLTDEIGFFTAMPETVIEMTPEIGSDAAFLFLYLRYRTNKERGSAWPGYNRMRQDIKWGNTRIKKAIQVLIDHSLVEVKKRFGQTNVYRLKPPDIGVKQEDTASSPDTGELIDDGSIPETGEQFSQNGSEEFPQQELTQDSVKTDSVKTREDSRSQDLWAQALAKLHWEIPKHEFETWWRDTWVSSQNDGKIVVQASNQFTVDYLEENKAIAEKAFVGILGKTVEIEFVCQENE